MNIRKIEIEGATVPWRLSQDRLTKALTDLPVHIKGTKDLRLKASVQLGGIVKITPINGDITEYSLHNIRNPRIYVDGATYVSFHYHGISYDLGPTSPPI